MKNQKSEYVLGVLGGMGTYATIHLFKQYANIFPAEKEWERPRIIIDNNCTMPSRVRAVLYEEKREELVERMCFSIRHLLDAGATQIILGCNTAHLFLEDVYEAIPEARKYVINIIDICIKELEKNKVKKVYLLATEGTIASGIYRSKLEAAKIYCEYPDANEFDKLRLCIEAVKQNRYDEDVKKAFLNFISRSSVIILGCTELPILYEQYKRDVFEMAGKKEVYDPLYLALQTARNTYLKYTFVEI